MPKCDYKDKTEIGLVHHPAKSEEIVRFKMDCNKCSFITTFTDMLKSLKKSHMYHSTKLKMYKTSCDY